ncbi:hypothetical protein F5Y17DRAFT_368202 [Xylariaceae sp. FL0594]|nr:hypothetical protein F5Y17DRAFT_368202 [Xylariaceae sp. FL0594]
MNIYILLAHRPLLLASFLPPHALATKAPATASLRRKILHCCLVCNSTVTCRSEPREEKVSVKMNTRSLGCVIRKGRKYEEGEEGSCFK